MNFEKNRQELLNQIKSMHHKPASSHRSSSAKSKSDTVVHADAPKAVLQKKLTALFSMQVLFEKSIISLLGQRAEVKSFKETNTGIEYIVENAIDIVILDMDLPTDPKKSSEIFSNVHMMRPETKFILCGKSSADQYCSRLVEQGAQFVQKPLNSEEFLNLFMGK